MPVTENITNKTMRIKKGKPFTNSRFLKLGSRAAVNKTLSGLVKNGTLERVAQGVFVRPKESRFIAKVMPGVSQIIETIAKDQEEYETLSYSNMPAWMSNRIEMYTKNKTNA